jgi:2-keto-4-pentenoate hydratase/2-oxohepta-3-ene-1,7-dioic acid hydratase in catechol pathway
MKIVCFSFKSQDRRPRAGALVGDSLIFDFRAALEADGGSIDESAAGDMLAWLDLDGPWLPKARALYDEAARRGPDEAREGGAFVAREDVQLLAPVPRPGKIICIGLNYRDHAAESNMPIPESPVIFSKFGTSVAGPNQPVLLPPASTQVDYEAEMAVVIGRRARHVARERAYDYVLGYMNFNDVSARDFQFADKQWTRGKACDTFAPMGEYIATTDEIPDPHRLSIKLRLNGRTMQDSNTNQLIFGVPELIEFLSASITLEPGDVIATGTPPGVGFARTPPVFIKEGDVMEVEIEGLGILRNPVAAT